MKKIIYSFFVFTLFIVACSDNTLSNLAPLSKVDLVGTWKLVGLYSEGGQFTVSTVNNGNVSGTFNIKSENFNNSTTTFSSNPNKSYSNGSFDMLLNILTPSLSTNKTTLVTADSNIKIEWFLNNNTLYFNFENDFFSGQLAAKIISFNNNQMKLEASFEKNIDTEKNLDFGINNTKFQGNIYLTYNK